MQKKSSSSFNLIIELLILQKKKKRITRTNIKITNYYVFYNYLYSRCKENFKFKILLFSRLNLHCSIQERTYTRAYVY